MRMKITAPRDLKGCERYTEKKERIESLILSTVTNSWLSVVNTFGVLYEAVFESVCFKTGKAISIPFYVQQCVKVFNSVFPKIVPFITTSLFAEGEAGDHDFCRMIGRTMNGGLSLDK